MLASNSCVDNRLILCGKVSTTLKRSLSPAGIPTYYFWLEHRSKQIESGYERQAWCKIQVILSGNQFTAKTQNITVGCSVKVIGFIHTHQSTNGINQLVLHTEQIEFID